MAILYLNGLGEPVLPPSSKMRSHRRLDLSISSIALPCAILARAISFCEFSLDCTQSLHNCEGRMAIVGQQMSVRGERMEGKLGHYLSLTCFVNHRSW